MLKGILNVFRFFVLLLLMVSSLLLHAQNFDTTVAVVYPTDEEVVHFDKVDKSKIQPVEKRKVPDSIVAQLQNDEAFWYVNMAKKKAAEGPKSSSNFLANLLQQKWLKTLLWFLIIGAFLIVLIWYLASLNIQLFRRPSAPIKKVQGEGITEDIFSISYEQHIAAAVQSGNYRLAVRLLYLQALALLSKKELIHFKQDRTNSEYLSQLYQTAYYKDFFRLTRSFEYTWYGQFTLSKSAFGIVQKDFEMFNKRLAA